MATTCINDQKTMLEELHDHIMGIANVTFVLAAEHAQMKQRVDGLEPLAANSIVVLQNEALVMALEQKEEVIQTLKDAISRRDANSAALTDKLKQATEDNVNILCQLDESNAMMTRLHHRMLDHTREVCNEPHNQRLQLPSVKENQDPMIDGAMQGKIKMTRYLKVTALSCCCSIVYAAERITVAPYGGAHEYAYLLTGSLLQGASRSEAPVEGCGAQ